MGIPRDHQVIAQKEVDAMSENRLFDECMARGNGFPAGELQTFAVPNRLADLGPLDNAIKLARAHSNLQEMHRDLLEASMGIQALTREKYLLEAELKGLYEICYALEQELASCKAALVIDQPMVIRRSI